MAVLAATMRGELVGAHAWVGSVLSVHRSAVNIRRPDGLLVSVVTEPGGMTAMGVLAPGFSAPGAAGRKAWSDGGSIGVAGAPRIDLGRAAPWSGRVRRGPVTEAPALAAAAQALGALGPGEGLAPLLEARPVAEDPLHRTARRALAEWCGSTGSLAPLVGLGPGLTPAGDDFLTGLLLADELARRGRLPGRRAAILRMRDRADLEAGLCGTSAPGRTLLVQALVRRYPAYLLDLVDALSGAPTAEEVAGAIARATGHGATSGSDAAAGLLWGALQLRGGSCQPGARFRRRLLPSLMRRLSIE
jgi:hypothetical protein